MKFVNWIFGCTIRVMRICMLGVGARAAARAQRGGDFQSRLARVSEEAEVFAPSARSVLSEETLHQRTRKPVSRFHPRVAEATPPKEEFIAREIVSEYGYSSFKDSPAALHEFRTVVSIDGRKVAAAEKARRTLTLGMASSDDGVKKQILRGFEKHGLIGAATEFGHLILLFSKRRLADYDFEIAGQDRIGADAATKLKFKQKGGQESLTVFAHNQGLRSALQGFLRVRTQDSMPLRIRLGSS